MNLDDQEQEEEEVETGGAPLSNLEEVLEKQDTEVIITYHFDTLETDYKGIICALGCCSSWPARTAFYRSSITRAIYNTCFYLVLFHKSNLQVVLMWP